MSQRELCVLVELYGWTSEVSSSICIFRFVCFARDLERASGAAKGDVKASGISHAGLKTDVSTSTSALSSKYFETFPDRA